MLELRYKMEHPNNESLYEVPSTKYDDDQDEMTSTQDFNLLLNCLIGPTFPKY